MIRNYTPADRIRLCDFFSFIVENHKDYISHGELQMGVASDPGQLTPDYKDHWLRYLDRQTGNPDNSLLICEEKEKITGFVLFGIANDGAQPYGLIFDLSVSPERRGQHIGLQLLQEALGHFRERGIKDCYLESGVNNHSAHHFFRKHGFNQVSDIFRLKL